MKMKANDLSQFTFRFAGSGHYRVTYSTLRRGDYWVLTVDDMWLIDHTLKAEWAKAKDIEHLRHIVIRDGIHYNWKGQKI